jgi:hypothetical protein
MFSESGEPAQTQVETQDPLAEECKRVIGARIEYLTSCFQNDGQPATYEKYRALNSAIAGVAEGQRQEMIKQGLTVSYPDDTGVELLHYIAGEQLTTEKQLATLEGDRLSREQHEAVKHAEERGNARLGLAADLLEIFAEREAIQASPRIGLPLLLKNAFEWFIEDRVERKAEQGEKQRKEEKKINLVNLGLKLRAEAAENNKGITGEMIERYGAQSRNLISPESIKT